ncbi:MAG: site-specific integrase, partial [Ruminococcus sp.]|nr:site-specific integrase [Ruminococcus sp.]
LLQLKILTIGFLLADIINLKWNCCNLLYSKEYGIYEDTTKTDTSDRIIRLTQETAELLKEYRAWWERLRREAGANWNSFIEIADGKGVKHYQKADFLFIKDSGDNIGYPMHPDSVTDWLDKFSEKNNLPHINPHAFRHTLASVLCLNGIDITTISKWLGHKNVTTTMNIYEHILEQGKEQVVDCVADVILKKA